MNEKSVIILLTFLYPTFLKISSFDNPYQKVVYFKFILLSIIK